MKRITQFIGVISAIFVFAFTTNAQTTSAQVGNNLPVSVEIQTQIQEGLSQQTRGNYQTSNRTITPIYVGSFNTNDGPNWNDAPPALSAIEAAALIFGGRAVDYVISTNPNTTDPSTITNTAWATKYGIANCHEVAEDYFLDQGTPGYNINGDTSAYVDDNCLSGNTNYVWSVRVPSNFITTWETTAAGESITIPTAAGSVYNYDVDWESDGTWETGFTGDATHTYATAGTYMVTIRGTFPRIYFNNTGNKDKIKAINQWGYQIWESMESAFYGCSNLIYNSSDTPDLSAVTSMANMFNQTTLFDADISNWDVSNVTEMTDMFTGVSLTTFYYDTLLTAWSNLSLQNNVNFSAGSSHFCHSETARDNIINIYGWTISDGGKLCVIPDAFITTWQTTVPNESITIPISFNSLYNYDVDWEGFGIYETGFTGTATHTYTNPGIHTVVIRGTFPRIYFNNSGDKNKIMSIEKWGPNAWESMQNAFYGCSNLTYNATDAPNLTLASNMSNMLSGASTFNGDLNSWDVSTINNMTSLFNNATSFNGDISSWEVSNVTGMSQTFSYAAAFNKDIGNWDVSSVTDMGFMFYEASSFNQDISGWNVGNVTTMTSMFEDAIAFNQNLGSWNVSNVSSMDNMLQGASLTTANYDALLNGWNTLTLQNGISFAAGNSQYCSGETARNNIITEFGWTIFDGGLGCTFDPADSFITTWKTNHPGTSNATSITIPTTGSGYSYDIDWNNDGTFDDFGVTGNITHDYGVAGTYTVAIRGDFPRIYFNNGGDRGKILSIEQWGTNTWSSMNSAFMGCDKLVSNATDTPDFSTVNDMYGMFAFARLFNGDLNMANWDVSNVTSMHGMFAGASKFDNNIGNWNVSSVTDMENMFYGATLFNQDIGNWDVGNASTMKNMFRTAMKFNQDIGNWNVGNVTTMNSMFAHSNRFDQNIGSWNVSNVTNMTNMFTNVTLSTTNYDALLTGWNSLPLKSNVKFSGGKSKYCTGDTARTYMINTRGWTITDGGQLCDPSVAFVTTWQTTTNNETITIPTIGSGYNYDINWGDGSGWQIGKTGDATKNYAVAGSYTVTIQGDFPRIYFNNAGDRLKIKTVEQWGDVVWSSMNSAFTGCENLISNATDTPDFSMVTDMYGMFAYARVFNGDVNMGNWDVSNVTNMNGTFAGASVFNRAIGNWNVGNVTTMENMFFGATIFNQDIGAWNVGSVITMKNMFATAMAFNQDISNWNVGNVTTMNSMFTHANQFDQNIGGWNVGNVINMTNMFKSVTLSTANYDALLNGWNSQSLKNNVKFSGGNSKYCDGEAARSNMTNTFGWTITDGGKECFGPLAERLEVNSNDPLFGITLYPNPMADQLNLGNPKNIELESISIYDLTGRLVQKVDLRGITSGTSVDVSTLSSATYLVLISGKDVQASKLMIKD